jgi:hypothetical protein
LLLTSAYQDFDGDKIKKQYDDILMEKNIELQRKAKEL